MSEITAYEFLLADGWKEYLNRFKKSARCFYKHFETPTPCHCNSDKPGIQVEITAWEWEGRERYELELTGELSDGTWFQLLNYALPSDIRKVVKLIPRLLAAWETSNVVFKDSV